MSTSLCSGSMRHVQPFTSARPSNRRITSARGQILCAKVVSLPVIMLHAW